MLRSSSRSLAFGSLLGLVLAASACGGGQPEAKAPESTAPAASVAPSASAAPASASGAPAKPWKELTLSEKKAHMKTVVVPKMGEVFKAFDAKDFAEFGCVTCHGKSAKNGKFDMPNPDLPKLTPAGNFKKHMDAKPEITKFMMEKVEPTMAGALGMQPYNPETHQGFSCGGCHVIEH